MNKQNHNNKKEINYNKHKQTQIKKKKLKTVIYQHNV